MAMALKGGGQGNILSRYFYLLISTGASHWLSSMRSQRAREPIDAVQEGQRASHRAWEREWRTDIGGVEVGTKYICCEEGQIVQ